MTITKDQLLQIVPYAKYSKLDLDEVCTELSNAAELSNVSRLSAFIAQCAQESGSFVLISENLRYSAEGLMKTWPFLFPDIASTQAYAGQPEKIANKVYANKVGNGDEASGDGWKFRGRGFIQLTFRDNYLNCSKNTGLDLINHPEILETITGAVKSAIWFFHSNGLFELADRNQIDAITKIINYRMLGADDRKAFFIKALQVLSP